MLIFCMTSPNTAVSEHWQSTLIVRTYALLPLSHCRVFNKLWYWLRTTLGRFCFLNRIRANQTISSAHRANSNFDAMSKLWPSVLFFRRTTSHRWCWIVLNQLNLLYKSRSHLWQSPIEKAWGYWWSRNIATFAAFSGNDIYCFNSMFGHI